MEGGKKKGKEVSLSLYVLSGYREDRRGLRGTKKVVINGIVYKKYKLG